MIYQRFNYYIYDYYFNPQNSGDEIILSVDESVINQFQKKNKISNLELQESFKCYFHRNWKYALELNGEIPNYFGLIAIQIYIASLMEDDEINDFTKNDYNPRLSQYLGITENNIENIYSKWQDKIWQNFKTWAVKNNYHIYVDEIGKYKGRYIKYPLSHSLLNKEDFKFIPLLFDKCGLMPNEDISFKDFKEMIKRHIDDQSQSRHFKKIKLRLESEDKERIDRLYKQIFGFYINEWDGQLPAVEDKTIKENFKSTNNKIENENFYYDYNENVIRKISYNNILLDTIKLTDLNLFNKIKKGKIILSFEKGNYEEWQYTRFLSYQTHIIVCEKHQSYLINQLGNVIADFSDKSNNLYSIKEVEVTNYNPRFFSKESNQYSIENGLKIGRNQWLKNAGPDIVINDDIEIRINGVVPKEKRISLRDYDVGIYKIRGAIKPTIIEIVEFHKNSLISIVQDSGWCIEKNDNKWQNVYNELNINGLHYKFKKLATVESAQTWINAVLKKQKKQKYKTQVINALNRINYGI